MKTTRRFFKLGGFVHSVIEFVLLRLNQQTVKGVASMAEARKLYPQNPYMLLNIANDIVEMFTIKMSGRQ
jgi:hypothetical protein